MQIVIDGPKTLVIQPQHLATVLDCLSNAPFKVAQPIIEDIFKQLKEQKGEQVDGQGSDRVAT